MPWQPDAGQPCKIIWIHETGQNAESRTNMTANELWEEYASREGVKAVWKTWSFGSDPDAVAALVRDGINKATASACWRQVHEAYFRDELAAAGLPFHLQISVLCEEFEVVYLPELK